jgi:hypothetical protein
VRSIVVGICLSVFLGGCGRRSNDDVAVRNKSEHTEQDEVHGKQKEGTFNSDDWVKKKLHPVEIPQWSDVYAKLPKNISDSDYNSLRDSFFQEVLWPVLLKKGLADKYQYSSTLDSFMRRTERSIMGPPTMH